MMQMRRKSHRVVATMVVITFACSLVAGCGGGGWLGQMFKVAHTSAFLPSDWSAKGGLVKILADVTGYTTIQKVIALIKKLGSSDSHEVVLTANSEGKFEGAFTAAENTSTQSTEQYSVVVTATDASGQTAQSDEVKVEVPPAK